VKLEKEFLVAQPRDRVAGVFDDDATYCALFPDTRVVASRAGVRETLTAFTALGARRDIRFVFRTQPDGNLRFEKVCDGNVWRSLEGEVLLQPSGPDRTRVVLRMEGRTRAFVPELAIRGPMKEQLEQMASALRDRIETA
jgi:hypothetical protein